MASAQLDTTITYKTKHVHTVAVRADSSTLSWKADTIRYSVPFDIKFTKSKIIVDGYGTFKISKHELHSGYYHWHRLSNGGQLTWIENAVILEYPIVRKKTKTIIFEIE
jgi:hypothetical protein